MTHLSSRMKEVGEYREMQFTNVKRLVLCSRLVKCSKFCDIILFKRQCLEHVEA